MFNTQGLTNTEKYLLAYIEEHLEEIPSISIVKLSQEKCFYCVYCANHEETRI